MSKPAYDYGVLTFNSTTGALLTATGTSGLGSLGIGPSNPLITGFNVSYNPLTG